MSAPRATRGTKFARNPPFTHRCDYAFLVWQTMNSISNSFLVLAMLFAGCKQTESNKAVDSFVNKVSKIKVVFHRALREQFVKEIDVSNKQGLPKECASVLRALAKIYNERSSFVPDLKTTEQISCYDSSGALIRCFAFDNVHFYTCLLANDKLYIETNDPDENTRLILQTFYEKITGRHLPE
jgi:hypothetical protein